MLPWQMSAGAANAGGGQAQASLIPAAFRQKRPAPEAAEVGNPALIPAAFRKRPNAAAAPGAMPAVGVVAAKSVAAAPTAAAPVLARPAVPLMSPAARSASMLAAQLAVQQAMVGTTGAVENDTNDVNSTARAVAARRAVEGTLSREAAKAMAAAQATNTPSASASQSTASYDDQEEQFNMQSYAMQQQMLGMQTIAMQQQMVFSAQHSASAAIHGEVTNKDGRLWGTVLDWDPDRCFGFIRSEGAKKLYGGDVFFHQSEITHEADQMKLTQKLDIPDGEGVTFSVDFDKGRARAVKVKFDSESLRTKFANMARGEAADVLTRKRMRTAAGHM
mmetsp:Transcript_70978/g.197176  ORF Transcript_70978/g.197176 Transcript_70978/m.197176 type:complete len:333 (-) Transcript_70978:198-1196(-)